MENINEKRRSRRIKADLKLHVSSLFKQDNVLISDIDSPIEVKNISKHGIGFLSASRLPVGYYFNAALKLTEEDGTLYCVVKIIRCQPVKDPEIYSYGCEFVGIAPVLDYIFEDYEQEINEKEG